VVSSNPILWIKSSTFFGLLRRRLTDYQSLHDDCFNARVPNYRTMSLVIGHLMRYVIVTPTATEVDLLQTMRELRFQEVMNTFGIFYMDISLINLSCSEIPGEDSPLLINKFKTPFLPKSPSKQKISRLALVASRLSQQYPWGDTIGIRQLQELINTCPSQFLAWPAFLTEDDMKHPDSAGIFRAFSIQIWLLSRDYFHAIPGDINVSDLTAAMKVWTVEGLKDRCQHISLQPTFNAIEAVGKLPQTSFLGRRSHFFPDENEVGAHPCDGYLVSDTSYLSMYHKALSLGGDDARMKINDDLERILALLQCLPASSKDRGKIVIWKVGSDDCLQFIVNSSLYRAKWVSARSVHSQPRPRPQLTQAMLRKKLNVR
jgi:hypothetical protein